ncbi:MAG: hypothetical protein K2N35_10820 [Muribaculaceae bacterium]|nr:hypothetical protein [Muribaculaceae bacterium]
MSEVKNQTQALQLLIKNERVYELARKISEEGYFVGEEPIICIEKEKKIVLEGNRRIAALKILQNPAKFLPSIKAKILQKNIIDNNIDVDRKIKCFIAPNRILANPIIYERHRGDAVQKWKTGNQYAFVAKMYEEGLSIKDICDLLNETRANILNPLKTYHLFIEGQNILQNRDEHIDFDTFDVTNLERFCSLPEVSDFIGVRMDNDSGCLYIGLPKEEFEERVFLVFKAIMNSDNFSREYNRRDSLIQLLNRIKSSESINLSLSFSENESNITSKSENLKKNLEDEKAKITTRRKRRYKTYFENNIIPRETDIFFGNNKLDSMFQELKGLSLDKVNSFAFLIRAYLEQGLYYYLQKNNLLEECHSLTMQEVKKSNEKKVHTLLTYLYKDKTVATQDMVNTCMNILRFNPSKDYYDVGLKAMLEYVVKYKVVNEFDTQTYKNLKDFVERIKMGLDLAIHNINNIVDLTHNRKAWCHLEPLLKFLSENIPDE